MENETLNEETAEQSKDITNTKFCKHCGERIDVDYIICPKCGKQVEELKSNQYVQPNVVINNTNTNLNHTCDYGKEKNKWAALLLCLFFGYFGAHKFYECKIGMGILYILTMGFFGIGIIIDLITILCKPNPYYV